MQEDDKQKNKIKIRSKNGGNRKMSYKWVFTILCWTFVISSSMQLAQEVLMQRVNLIMAFVILFCFILLGIVFDIIGVAVTAADETPFHSLSSRKIRGAKEAVRLIRNADKVGNFCNDVIGDICGIISGSASAAIVLSLHAIAPGSDQFVLSIVLSGLVAAITVGGKAAGKAIAISNCNSIIFHVGKLVSFVAPVRDKKEKKASNVRNNK